MVHKDRHLRMRGKERRIKATSHCIIAYWFKLKVQTQPPQPSLSNDGGPACGASYGGTTAFAYVELCLLRTAVLSENCCPADCEVPWGSMPMRTMCRMHWWASFAELAMHGLLTLYARIIAIRIPVYSWRTAIRTPAHSFASVVSMWG